MFLQVSKWKFVCVSFIRHRTPFWTKT